MPLPRWLKLCWDGSNFCGRCALTLCCWSCWLLLAVLAGIQVWIASVHQLSVPTFVLDNLSTRFAQAGLRVEFGAAQFDPGGHVLLRDVSVSFVSLPEPVLRADAIYCELDPIALWLRQVEPKQVRLSGAELMIPAMLSPTGISEAFVRDLDTTLRPGRSAGELTVGHLTAHIGPLPVDVSGTLVLPRVEGATRPPLGQLLDALAQHYVQACRRLADLLPRVPPHQNPRLSVLLTASPDHIADAEFTFVVDALTLAAPGKPVPAELARLRAHARLPLNGRARVIPIGFTLGAATLPGGLHADDVRGNFDAVIGLADPRFAPRLVELTARSIELAGVTIDRPSLQAAIAGLPQIQAQLYAMVAGEPVQVRADFDVLTRAGRIDLAARVGAPLLQLAADRTGVDVPALLQWQQSPEIAATLNLGAGGVPLRAEARFRTGPVVARKVPLDATAAHVTWSGTHLLADDILLLRGVSRATGSYEMDFRSLDFRFLLRGHLEPGDIAGWFRGWWPSLWSNFDFTHGPPEARVEVSGQWKAPLETQVWVQADGRNAAVKGIWMDRMRTRLFVRPGWSDVLEFIAERPQGEVRGSFARQWRMPDGRRWTLVEVHAEGDSDLSPAPKLLGSLGQSIIAPFTMSTPLHVRLHGTARREDYDAPIHTAFDIDGETDHDWTFLGFPLHGLDFHARQDDARLLIAPFRAGAAHGDLSGRIELTGPDAQRQVAFDLNLEKAALGESIRTVSTWLAARNGEVAAPESSYEQRIANGLLSVSLSALGPAADPFNYRGEGSASIENADLGELKLLGILSSLLGNSLLGFSKMQLNYANGDFQLDRNLVQFPNVRVTGRQGALDANGRYNLRTNRLDFLARVRPFEGSQSLLDAVFTPLTRALEVKLTGQLNAPEWNFVYGPTNLFRSLTGENDRPDPASAPVNPPAAPVPPVPPAAASPGSARPTAAPAATTADPPATAPPTTPPVT